MDIQKHALRLCLFILLISLPAITEAQATPKNKEAVLNSFAGAYLAGQFAHQHQDYESAYLFHKQILTQDPNHDALLGKTFFLALSTGDFKNAEDYARQIIFKQKKQAELAHVFLATLAIQNKNYHEAKNHITQLPEKSFGQFSKPLLLAWVDVGSGHPQKAVRRLEHMDNDPTFLFHTGLIYAYVKNVDEAKKYFKKAITQGSNVLNALIIAEYFKHHDETKFAQSIYEGIKDYNAYSAESLVLTSDTERPYTPPSPSEALALAFLEIASVLNDRDAVDSALIYARMAENLSPQSEIMMILMGDIYLSLGQYQNAHQVFKRVPSTSNLYWMASIKSVEAYEMMGNHNEAIALLQKLAQPQNPYYTKAIIYLGDLYRRNEDYASAITYYTKALQKKDLSPNQQWPVYYARGITYHALDQWNQAEKDFKAALKINPDHADLLNFLAYGWVEKGINLSEAEPLLKKAVMLKPDDGYILDSYGWLKYKKGEYQEAARLIEKALELEPLDAVINDHLGDIYLKLNRKNEALFQWKRALSVTEDKKDRLRLQKKIEAIELQSHKKPHKK